MNPVASLPLPTRKKRVSDDDIEWKKCIFCQDDKLPKKKNPLSNASATGIDRVIECAHDREKYNDDSFIHVLDRFRTFNIIETEEDIIWHRSCYSDFTNKSHIQRLKQRCKPNIPSTSGTASTEVVGSTRHSRSSIDAVDWSKCIYCQTDIQGTSLNQVQTVQTSTKMIRYAQYDAILRCRLAGVHDMMAAEGKYHLKCYSQFLRKYSKRGDSSEQEVSPQDICFENVMVDLQRGIARGNVYSLKSVWEYYSEMLASDFELDAGIYRSNRFKDKIQQFLGDKVYFVNPLNPTEPQLIFPSTLTDAALRSMLKNEKEDSSDEESECFMRDTSDEDNLDHEILSWLFRVAVKVHNDIMATPGHGFIGGIDVDHAQNVVPESLYLFIRLLCAGDIIDDEDESDSAQFNRNRILSICQDIVFLVSAGRKLTPKHIGIGLTVHQATRSKDLIQLLHAAGHTVSYDRILRIDNAIANDVLQRYYDQGQILIPRNFAQGTNTGYVRYADDNTDINEETLSGMGTFHATQYAALRRRIPGESKMDIHIESTSSRNLMVHPELNELQEARITTDKPEPVFPGNVQNDWYEPDKERVSQSNTLDLAWILSRQAQPENQHVPSWSGFNQKVSKNDPPQTEIGPLPIINAPAHDFDTIWTVMKKCEAMTKHLNERYTVITFDEQLYCKAKMLQWDKAEECTDFIFMLGGFHTQMNFSKVIGHHMEASGLSDIWIESGVFGQNTAENIIKGKVWNRVIRAHKLSFEALWKILWPQFISWAELNDKVIDDKLTDLAGQVADGFYIEDQEKIESSLTEFVEVIGQTTGVIDEFDADNSANATFLYWRQYMKLISILLRFTRAIRDGDWSLYLSSFAEMLPWFAAYDHVHYTRWGTIFLADMKSLQFTAPDVYQGFVSGDFVTKETSQKFNQISDDQALEHVNKVGKVAGGLVGITRTDTARDRWCITYNERAQLSQNTKAMFSLITDEDGDEMKHKDFGPKRMLRDQEDVNKLVEQFERFSVFGRDCPDLVSLTTGDVASEDVKSNLLKAEETGKKVLSTFVEDRLIKKSTRFHESIKKQKLKTFESMYTVQVNTGKQKTVSIKADRDLFQRVIVALEAGREVDVDKLLEQELSPVPLSLATIDGKLRTPTNKADLSKILVENLAQNNPPVNLDSTCIIMDGMAMVQSLGNRSGAKTFGEWCDNFQKVVNVQYSETCTRVDIVFDRYLENSIKGGTRSKRVEGRGKGIRRKVESRDQNIGNWERFICLGENKASLANFLSTELATRHHSNANKVLILSGGFADATKVWASTEKDVSALSSNHEEADTRIILHAEDARNSGFQQVNIICRDTDVLVLLVAHMPNLCQQVWMQAGTARKKRYIPAHMIQISDAARAGLLAFHALSGSDTTSQFAGIGKQSAWKVFVRQPQLLVHLGEDDYPNESVLRDAEAFVCKLFESSTEATSIQQVRSAVFRKTKKNIDSLPPTKEALNLHIRRCHFQAFIWRKALVPCPTLPSAEESGWFLTADNILKPRLLTSAPVSVACLELTSCNCQIGGMCCATRRCSCTRLALPCTGACPCKDYCRNPNMLDE